MATTLLRAIGQTNGRGRIFGIFSTLMSFEHKVGENLSRLFRSELGGGGGGEKMGVLQGGV